jgi:hypothetical protein
LPKWGVLGAVAAFLVSRALEGIYLGAQTMRAYGIGVRSLAHWTDLFKVLLAAALAATIIAPRFWAESLGIVGVALGGAVYFVVFVLLLALFRIPEAAALVRVLRSAPAFVSRRMQ